MQPSFLSNPNSLFFLIAGPCVIENEEMPFQIAEEIQKICNTLHIPFIFKASYQKANRSSIHSFTGIGNTKALEILGKIREKYHLPTLTDIHTAEEAELAAPYVDVLQIPAFLCRQTELLQAAAKTSRYVNIKKGQFLSPESMKYAVEKVKESSPSKDNFLPKVMLTERGTTFGYQDLVVDFRSIPIMQENQVPVIMDVTHSLQQPNQANGVTGGEPRMIETIAKAAIACGADGLFIETHPNPATALSDGSNMLSLELLEPLLRKLVRLHQSL
ncbi:MAG: 3-deoxy-8-phosphooctulonate synthase [Bacteroidales bacterium]